MILKGNQRGGGRALAAHLLNARDNDHVEVHELRGFASADLLGAFLEIEATAAGTKCQQPFFSVSLNPPSGCNATFDQYEMAADAVEQKFPGLDDQPRAIVFHEKEGRRHAHAVWSRIDADRNRAVTLSHSRLKLRDVSRSLYQAMGLEVPAGLQDRARADPLNYDQATWQQAKRLGEDPRDLKSIIRQAWAVSDNRASFESALERHALFLARGDRRGYVVVHHSGEAMSLTRYADLKKKDIQARIGKPEQLQTIDQVRDVLTRRMTDAAQKRQADLKEKQRRELSPSMQRAAKMKEAHLAARQALKSSQAQRQGKEEADRAKRLRKGVMGLWDRLSGKRGKVSELNAREATAGRVRDRDERQSLIDQQRGERGQLQAEVMKVRQRHQHEREYQRAELAVMMSMMKNQVRETFQDHAQEIDRNIAPQREADRDADAGRDRFDESFKLR